MDNQPCIAYVTTKDRQEAEKIAEHLVKNNLAACCNIVDNITSVYRWQGKVEQDKECLLFAKCTETSFDGLLDAVRKIHSYELPCVVKIPIQGGNPEFLQWVRDETCDQ
jgi:periplasmic divalent cation tolerance protein